MKILIRNRKHEKWHPIEATSYSAEAELQCLIGQEPSLINIDDVREGSGTLAVAIREFPLDIGSIDILGFSSRGDIAVIECKLASNTEIKRKVISQVFEYGANLWEMNYESLNRKVLDKTKKTLVDLVKENISESDWDEESFKINIEDGLQQGKFILMIVVDEVNEEMSRIIRFINYAGKPEFSLSALEIQRYQHGETEMLVPHVYGIIEKGKPGGRKGGGKRWNEESFFEDLGRKAPTSYQIMKDIYEWSKTAADVVRFGMGIEKGSFTFCLKKDEKIGSIFSAFTNGTIWISFGYMDRILTAEQIREISIRLASALSIKEIAETNQSFFIVWIEKTFARPEILEAFKSELIRIKESLN